MAFGPACSKTESTGETEAATTDTGGRDEHTATSIGAGDAMPEPSSTSTGAPPATGDPGDSNEGDTGDTGDTGDSSDSGGFVLRPDMGDTSLLPLGEPCESNEQCQSDACFLVFGTFAICSDCSGDADCHDEDGVGTCSAFDNPYGLCTFGEPGVQCEETASCQDGLLCAESFGFSTCSTCATHGDCDEPTPLCVPSLTEGLRCVAPGTVADAEPCLPEDPEACAGGHCTDVIFMGSPTGVSLCGTCTDDEDCADDAVCTAAGVEQGEPFASACQ